MPEAMPFSLVAAWVLLFGLLNTHQRSIAGFRGASVGYLAAMKISFTAGCLAGLGLLIYYFLAAAWYWPVVLFLIGAVVGGIIFAIIDGVLGEVVLSFAAFLWPAVAIWMYLIVRQLGV